MGAGPAAAAEAFTEAFPDAIPNRWLHNPESMLELLRLLPPQATTVVEQKLATKQFDANPLILKLKVWRALTEVSQTPDQYIRRFRSMVDSKSDLENRLGKEVLFELSDLPPSVLMKPGPLQPKLVTATMNMLGSSKRETQLLGIEIATRLGVVSPIIRNSVFSKCFDEERSINAVAREAFGSLLHDSNDMFGAFSVNFTGDDWPDETVMAAGQAFSKGLPANNRLGAFLPMLDSKSSSVVREGLRLLPNQIDIRDESTLYEIGEPFQLAEPELSQVKQLRERIAVKARDGSAAVREMAVVRLLRMPETDELTYSQAAEAGLSDNNEQVVQSTLRCISRKYNYSSDVLDAVRRLSDNDSTPLRHAALGAVDRLGLTTKKELIKRALKDKDPELAAYTLRDTYPPQGPLRWDVETWRGVLALASETQQAYPLTRVQVRSKMQADVDNDAAVRSLSVDLIREQASQDRSELPDYEKKRGDVAAAPVSVTQTIAQQLASSDESTKKNALQLVWRGRFKAPSLLGAIRPHLNSHDEETKFQAWCAASFVILARLDVSFAPGPLGDQVWHPPMWSTNTVISCSTMKSTPKTYGAAHDALLAAISTAGFGFHQVEEFSGDTGGFVMWTGLERIDEMGVPPTDAQERFSKERRPLRTWSLREWLFQLLAEKPGNFRMFVFVVKPGNVSTSGQRINGRSLLNNFESQSNVLSGRLANKPIGLAQCHVLVYAFRKESEDTLRQIPNNGTPSPEIHLQKAGILLK